MSWDVLQRKAQTRWLTANELEDVLLSTKEYGSCISTSRPEAPPISGSLFLYDRSATKNYKDDGHLWIKKRNSHKVREDHVKLRMDGVNRISGCYNGTNFFLVLVHYLDTDTAASNLLKVSPDDKTLDPLKAKPGRVAGRVAGRGSRAFAAAPTSTPATARQLSKQKKAAAALALQQQQQAKARRIREEQQREREQQQAMRQQEKRQVVELQQQVQQQSMYNSGQLPSYNTQAFNNPFEDEYQSHEYNPHHHQQQQQQQQQQQHQHQHQHQQQQRHDQHQHHQQQQQQQQQHQQNQAHQRVAHRPSASSIDWAEHLGTMDGSASPSNFDFDSMDIPMSPANHSLGGVSGLSGILEGDDIPGLSRKSFPQNIIDVTPECLEFAKLGKSKVLITLDRGVDRGGTTMFVLAFVAECPFDQSKGSRYRKLILISLHGPEQISSDLALDMKAAIIDKLSNKSPDFFGNDTFTFLTDESDDSLEIEGIEEPEDDPDLPAPYPAMASIATALADFPSPPPGVQQAIINENANENVKRKRSAGEVNAPVLAGRGAPVTLAPTSISSTNTMPPPPPRHTSVEAWASKPSNMYEEDNTIGEDVDRHCKIRFVEKAITIIAGAEDDRMNMEDSWSIPTMAHQTMTAAGSSDGGGSTRDQFDNAPGTGVGSNDGNSSLGGSSSSGKQKLDDSHTAALGNEAIAAKAAGEEGKQVTLGVGLNPLEFLDDNQLGSMDDDQLDNVLDSLLIRIVETLVEMSASDNELQAELNAPDKSGFTLLHYASLYNLQSLVPVLLSRGANPDTPTIRGKLTPLHLACGAGNEAICELLVRHGCAVNVNDSFKLTPADHAMQNGFEELHNWLLEKSGMDIKKRQMDRTAEMERMEAEKKPGMQPGANVNAENDQKHLIQQAFSNLSLKDKLAINMIVKKSDRESLDIAMSLMNDSDLQTLQDDSVKIQGNVKAWMLRRNYQTLREATVHLKNSLEDYYGEPMSGEQNIEMAESLKEAVVAGREKSGLGGDDPSPMNIYNLAKQYSDQNETARALDLLSGPNPLIFGTPKAHVTTSAEGLGLLGRGKRESPILNKSPPSVSSEPRFAFSSNSTSPHPPTHLCLEASLLAGIALIDSNQLEDSAALLDRAFTFHYLTQSCTLGSGVPVHTPNSARVVTLQPDDVDGLAQIQSICNAEEDDVSGVGV
ncbi:hypothetical protein TrRE_jg286, partial [Triparma retinervis]